MYLVKKIEKLIVFHLLLILSTMASAAKIAKKNDSNFAKRKLAEAKDFTDPKTSEEIGTYSYVDPTKFDTSKDINFSSIIIGPDDTPYALGFFLTLSTIPVGYPMQHPMIVLRTLDPRVRFGPNLYTCGKICLSLIGTWANGDKSVSWTAQCSMRTLFIATRSLMSDNALRNEPHHESDSPEKCKPYDNLIKWYTIEVAIIGMLKRPVDALFPEQLKTLIEKYFVKHFAKYMKLMDKYISEYEGKTLPETFGTKGVKCEYKKLKGEMQLLYETFKPKYPELVGA